MSKRKSESFDAVNDDDLEQIIESMPITDSCNVVRGKIRRLIDSGEMKVGEFQKAIGANSNSYSRFMSQNGPHNGSGSTVYSSAWAFFKKRELRGVKTAKKSKTTTAATGEGDKTKNATVDIADVVLDGEMEDAVEVYDTCDEVRRKINAHLRKPGVTQAQFLRDIAAQYRTGARTLQSKQLADFRSKKGPYAGNTSAIFYGAYVFFEKVRIKEGKPKSKMRREMESIYAATGGLDTDRRRDYITAPIGALVSEDKYGQIEVHMPGSY